MLHIVLMILKIIGILLLAIILLAAGILLLVLLVPLRYRIRGSYAENLKGTIKVTWLLHMISVLAAYEDDISVTVRVFGFRLRGRKQEDPDLSEDTEDMVKTAGGKGTKVLEDPLTDDDLADEPGMDGEEELVHATSIPDFSEKASDDPLNRTGFISNLLKKCRDIRTRWKSALRQLRKKLKNLLLQKEKLVAFLKNEENQKTFRLIWKQSKFILRHMVPRIIRGKITFGFEDPYTTGQVLSAVSLAYPVCHKQMEFYPVFGSNILEGECYLKGHIRFGTILLAALKIYMNKNFRKLLKQWRNF